MATLHKNRSSWAITWSVWRALFIREALQRTMADRFSWFWILALPIIQIFLFIGLRETLGKMDTIAGADYIPWLIVGMMVFSLFSEGVVRSLGAIEANRGLLSYRQVLAIDTVIVRVFIEGFIKAVVYIILIFIFEYFGTNLIPKDILSVFIVWVLAWSFGLGMGIFSAVLSTLVKDLAVVFRISVMPLYFLSGVMIPVNYLPHSVQQILIVNPVLHLVEMMRSAWFLNYSPISGLNPQYVFLWVIATTFLGLLFYMNFKDRLVAS